MIAINSTGAFQETFEIFCSESKVSFTLSVEDTSEQLWSIEKKKTQIPGF